MGSRLGASVVLAEMNVPAVRRACCATAGAAATAAAEAEADSARKVRRSISHLPVVVPGGVGADALARHGHVEQVRTPLLGDDVEPPALRVHVMPSWPNGSSAVRAVELSCTMTALRGSASASCASSTAGWMIASSA